MRHKILSIVLVLLMTASSVFTQSSTNSTPTPSERERYITKIEFAVQEVIRSREYIAELERNLAADDAQIAEMEKAGVITKAELEAKRAEADELRKSIEALKTANTERVKEIGKMQQKILKLQGQVSFWRKVAIVTGLSAAGLAWVVLHE